MTLADYVVEGEKRFGSDKKDWKFVCSSCGTVQGFHDFVRIGVKKSEIANYLGFSCIGRFTEGETGTEGKIGCDWTLGGLFQVHTLEVIDDSGKKHPRFEFAEPEKTDEVKE